MAQRVRTQNKTGNQYRTNAAYVHGTALPQPDIRRRMEETPNRKLSNETRKNRDKAHHMNLGYVLFLTAALCVAGVVLINYIQLQAELTNQARHISSLEVNLNHLKLQNDEAYSNIVNSVDLEEIKRIAIGELGMAYAKEGQIITYTTEGNDYFRAADENGQ